MQNTNINNKPKKKKLRIGIIIFRIISLIIIIICIRYLMNWHKENSLNNEIISDLQNDQNIEQESIDVSSLEENAEENSEEQSDEDVQVVSTNFDELRKKNPDTVGWIYVARTNVNFPIVQSRDNNYYLKHNFKKQYNSAGWIYADYRNNFEELDQNTIIYGHNRRNGTMFSNLKKFLNKDFATQTNAEYFSFNVPGQRYIAKIYSVYKISSDKLLLTNNFETVRDYQNFIDNAKSMSTIPYDTEVTVSDKTITLCTCDDNTAYRIAIHAKLIPIE